MDINEKITFLKNLDYGKTIAVANDPTDSYTKISDGEYKGYFESHLYFGDIFSIDMLAEQLEDVDIKIVED